MPLFKCFIRGENFPMTLAGGFQLMGFYTTRWVEAPSAEEAELVGLDMLKREYPVSEEDRRKAPDARVYFEEVTEVPDETPRVPNKGATWFSMDED